MPRSYDLNPVSITHHPTQRIDTAIGKLPPFDIQQIVDGFLTALKDLTGIDLTGIRDFLENVFGSIDWSDLPTPEAVWGFVVTTFIKTLNIFSIPADVQASINESLGHLQDALEGNYSGSGPIFLAVQALAEAWLKATDPLNAANLFGRIGMPQLAGGVSLADLTTATSNLLDPFTAESVPSSDGWSFNATEDAAQVVFDGSTKGLWLKSGVIKVEEGQPVNTTVKVKYSGVVSGAGDTIRYVLETYESEDGSGPMVPVVVDAITNPTGTISSPVTLGDTSWDIPVGVQSVRPLLEVDELVTAGTVYWVNTPVFRKTLLGVLSDGLPAALQKPLDDLQATWDKFKGGVGGTVDDIEDALNGAGQAIRDAIANALGHSGTGHTSANILTYLQSIPQTVVSGLGDLNTLTNQIRDILAGLVVTPINSTVQAIKDWFTGVVGKTQNLSSSGQLNVANLLGTLTQSQVSGLTTDLGNLQTTLNQIADIFNNAVVTPVNAVVQAVKDWWNQWFGGSSTNAIPLSQKGAANGVAPLDSSSLIPVQYIPGGAGGGGEPTDHILFTLAANQSIPSGAATALTGWQQVGSVTATFDDGTNTRWSFPKAGWWDIQSQIAWDTSTTGKRQSAIVRALSSGSTVPAIDGADAADYPSWGVRNEIRAIQEVGVRSPLGATDKFSVEAYQNSGGALDAIAGYPNGTYILATYLGQREADAVTVMPVAFDARGGGSIGSGTGSATINWNHTATGLDRCVVVFAAFQVNSGSGFNCTATYGGVGMTRAAFLTSGVGTGGVVVATFVMQNPPTGSKSVSVTATASSGAVYLVADSLSYTGVGSYSVSNTSYGGGFTTALTQSVSSASNRMVAQAFGVVSSNGLSGYSQTQRLTATYSGIVRMVAGDAAGAGTTTFNLTSSATSAQRSWGSAVDLAQVVV
ncbi:hypothetical protein [Mycolicibacterium peregrinum]|uniref:hypothetical protein n=1 Tax=Mycolicibacterium peregrinum TaxID=43304 RepID=UPI003AAB89E3